MSPVCQPASSHKAGMENGVSGLTTMSAFIGRKLGNFLSQGHVRTEQAPLFASVHTTAELCDSGELGLCFPVTQLRVF